MKELDFEYLSMSDEDFAYATGMTKEKLEKEAEEYANTHGTTVMGFEENLDCTDFMIEAYLAGAEPREKRIAELEKENAEFKSENQKWKDEWQEQVQKADDEGYARTLRIIQLTKAKEIIKDQKELLDRVLSGAETLSDFAQNTLRKAEKFIKENK